MRRPGCSSCGATDNLERYGRDLFCNNCTYPVHRGRKPIVQLDYVQASDMYVKTGNQAAFHRMIEVITEDYPILADPAIKTNMAVNQYNAVAKLRNEYLSKSRYDFVAAAVTSLIAVIVITLTGLFSPKMSPMVFATLLPAAWFAGWGIHERNSRRKLKNESIRLRAAISHHSRRSS